MKRPYCVGLTGGIGSGKSVVARLFLDLGAGVIDTDAIARQLSTHGGLAVDDLRKTFGPEYIAPDGGLDRARMREKAFSDPVARHRLEAILHPLIHARVEALLTASAAPYVLLVVPLLVETNAYQQLIDRILVVDCDPDQQIERIVHRDGCSDAMARAILETQIARATRLAAADDVIDNRGPPDDLAIKTRILHAMYLQAATANRPR